MTFSLCMIVKNEEEVLDRCLKSAHELFDEIIIVDTGSIDNTISIAKKYTSHIYHYVWNNDFSAARNFSFSKATKDYIMWLDADDIIPKNSLKKLKKLKKQLLSNIDIVMLPYEIAFDEFNNVTFSYYRERLLKRTKQYQWQDPIHEYISLTGTIQKENIPIQHHKIKKGDRNRNLKIYQDMEDSGYAFTPRNYYYYGRELHDHGLYEKAINIFEKFLDTHQGWVEDNIAACHLLFQGYMALSDKEKALSYLFKSFSYDIPRAKTCCWLGEYFYQMKQFDQAIFWYQFALSLPPIDTNGFDEKDYREFIPTIQLCVCYSMKNNYEKAYQYHLQSKQYKPSHPAVLKNDIFFTNIFKKEKE